MTEEQEPKVIEYSPSGAATDRLFKIGVGVLFALTWAGMGAMWQAGHTASPAGDVETRLAQLEKTQSAQAEDIARTSNDLMDITGRMPSALPAAGDDSAAKSLAQKSAEAKEASSEVEKLKNRLSVLEKEMQNAPREQEALNPLIMAMLQLRDRLQKGLPHEAEMQLVKDLSNRDDTITKQVEELESVSASALPTTSALRDEFSKIADDIVRAAQAGSGNSMMDRIRAKMAGAFVVRKVGEVEGADAEAVVARAEASLANNNVEGAVQELSTLQGAAAAVADPWLKKAKASARTDALFADIYARITTIAARKQVDTVTPSAEASAPADPAAEPAPAKVEAVAPAVKETETPPAELPAAKTE